MSYLRSTSLVALTSVTVLLAACQKSETAPAQASVPAASHAAELKTLSIGFQKSSLNSIVLKQQQLLEKEFPKTKVEWKEFPAGPQMLEALAVGAVDLGSVGNTPPIFAQAANKGIVYVGYENVHPKWQAVLVPNDSPIKTIADLKGKRIAVQKGSSAHDLLGRVLKKANLTWNDIQPIWLAPADARAALDKKSVDAWAIWEPFRSAAEVEGHARPIIDGTAFETTYNFVIGNPDFVKAHSQETTQFLTALNHAAQWIVDHPKESLQLYQQATGLNADIAQRVLDKRYKPSLTQAITPEVVKAQQEIANRFYQEKLIPNSIEINQIIWARH
ncbi:aliphatic sulfonate ABC transporter substrate-binding protein [Acinetobacter sp. ANC 3791]|uniref:aliphatic sulfonate ABC transporter substrate-binding protein n=1 Tax=Acinetobacter sp. ANC 3791 TaxID=2529836 RepID=UPI00103C5C9F|nr:aliphatic sulfonate ABC transporter substrate-binding protein [Acinetobacter sp. ANC 3791]TCB84529.1 aliphatic sulfonate ABC transporter substrate-binding protein [Acinetobacter sp. ANC 3791]